MTLIALLDHAAVLVFALTGALVASRAQLDIIGFAFLAILTGVGGGTVRDVILDRNPVFWLSNPTYLGIALGAAFIVFFTAHLIESRYRVMLWLDAAALAFAVAAGARIAANLDQSLTIIVVMGTLTGCLGGLMRDVVANEVPLVLKQGELYVTCAVAGAAVVAVAPLLGANQLITVLISGGATFALRAGSIALGWKLPVYKSRPPKV
ncbi:trimeric intracellular cation channel family protein [Marivita sp. S6314]|uniref:trimeric intracellular cation channel family protein n=1 Tax=Marivita sp. S6314 TaxID=2926406 RepID=UPI001FF5391B|nr:trimeric intracellular cation channel family protein [Marivita sp. S6314]MCK0150336.1 trimeric intracellular cation channel family protein [Marivita sp. S6314]